MSSKAGLGFENSPLTGFPLEAVRGLSSQFPVVEGGPAGSGVFGATISTAPERLGWAVLGNIGRE
jgi:hypothetical protein